MTTLTTLPVSILLERLFAEAKVSDAALTEMMAKLSPAARAARIANTDQKAMYTQAKDFYMAVSKESGTLCYMLARGCGARSIVEFGTSLGISTIHLAAAVKDNGGGIVIGTEFEPSKVARARAHLAAAGLADFAEYSRG